MTDTTSAKMANKHAMAIYDRLWGEDINNRACRFSVKGSSVVLIAQRRAKVLDESLSDIMQWCADYGVVYTMINPSNMAVFIADQTTDTAAVAVKMRWLSG